jgi:hypothetical protein
MRSLRNREYDRIVDKESLPEHNDFQYYMIQDKDTKIWHCVHIIQQINGDYLSDWAKRQLKCLETREEMTKNVIANAYLSSELREQIRNDEIKRNWKSILVRDYANDKQISAQIRELRQIGELPKLRSKYKPNIKGIRYVFAENASEIKLARAKLAYEQNDRKYKSGSEMGTVKVYKDGENLIKNMVKEVILCDYHRRDYQLPEPEVIDSD